MGRKFEQRRSYPFDLFVRNGLRFFIFCLAFFWLLFFGFGFFLAFVFWFSFFLAETMKRREKWDGSLSTGGPAFDVFVGNCLRFAD